MMGWRVVGSHFLEHFGQPVDGVNGRAIRAGEDANGEERAVNQRVGVIKEDGLWHGAERSTLLEIKQSSQRHGFKAGC